MLFSQVSNVKVVAKPCQRPFAAVPEIRQILLRWQAVALGQRYNQSFQPLLVLKGKTHCQLVQCKDVSTHIHLSSTSSLQCSLYSCFYRFRQWWWLWKSGLPLMLKIFFLLSLLLLDLSDSLRQPSDQPFICLLGFGFLLQ